VEVDRLGMEPDSSIDKTDIMGGHRHACERLDSVLGIPTDKRHPMVEHWALSLKRWVAAEGSLQDVGSGRVWTDHIGKY